MATTAKTAVKAADTVTVCLNFPHDVKFMVPDAKGKMQPVIFKGNAAHLAGKRRGTLPVGKYGLTFGVPAEAWDYIQRAYKDNELIKNGFLFAASAATAQDAAAERKKLRTGLEPVDPKTGKTEPHK